MELSLNESRRNVEGTWQERHAIWFGKIFSHDLLLPVL
jgi:hypothetical protein